MSDFVAVLKKTLEGLGETSPEMRQRVYGKARSTIAAKLAGMNPPPPRAVAERQHKALEDAIAEVERSYVPRQAPAEPLDELENVLNSLNGLKNEQAAPPKPRQPEAPRPVEQPRAYEQVRPVTTPTSRPPAPHQQPVRQVQPPVETNDEAEFEPFVDEDYASPATYDPQPMEPVRRRGYGRLLATLLFLIALGGAGYAAWLNKNELSSMVTDLTSKLTAQSDTATPVAAPEQPATPATSEQAQTDEPAPATNGPVKFSQKLNADGTEADAGPPVSAATVGEGSSVAEATGDATTPPVEGDVQDQTAPEEGTDSAEEPAPADQPADVSQLPAEGQAQPADQDAAVPVGQRAIFYEERTNAADGSAEPGSIVWSVVQESPGGDQPPEPAIRAEATIPGKDVQLRMTIRRNADTTLPASHIIEMIFLTPPNFEGGGIDNVLRVALKTSEQDAGAPLSGIPAKISDGFFLIALNDSQQDKDVNMRLLRERAWLDVPIIYKSGRRALITMEKGIPGEKVFDDVLKSWGIQGSG